MPCRKTCVAEPGRLMTGIPVVHQRCTGAPSVCRSPTKLTNACRLAQSLARAPRIPALPLSSFRGSSPTGTPDPTEWLCSAAPPERLCNEAAHKGSGFWCSESENGRNRQNHACSFKEERAKRAAPAPGTQKPCCLTATLTFISLLIAPDCCRNSLGLKAQALWNGSLIANNLGILVASKMSSPKLRLFGVLFREEGALRWTCTDFGHTHV